MAKFIITETRPATAVWTYEVEAESQTEAYAMVFDEYSVQPVSLEHDIDFTGEMKVDIKETK